MGGLHAFLDQPSEEGRSAPNIDAALVSRLAEHGLMITAAEQSGELTEGQYLCLEIRELEAKIAPHKKELKKLLDKAKKLTKAGMLVGFGEKSYRFHPVKDSTSYDLGAAFLDHPELIAKLAPYLGSKPNTPRFLYGDVEEE